MNKEELDYHRRMLDAARDSLRSIYSMDTDLARFVLDAERKVIECLSIINSREQQLSIEEAQRSEADTATDEQRPEA